MLGCDEMCLAEWLGVAMSPQREFSRRLIWMYDPLLCPLSKGVPLLLLYTRGAGLHDGVQVSYEIGFLVDYNCTSCVQGRSDSIPKLHVVLRSK